MHEPTENAPKKFILPTFPSTAIGNIILVDVASQAIGKYFFIRNRIAQKKNTHTYGNIDWIGKYDQNGIVRILRCNPIELHIGTVQVTNEQSSATYTSNRIEQSAREKEKNDFI